MALTDSYTLIDLPLPESYVFTSPYSFNVLLDRIYELYSDNGWTLNFSAGVLDSIRSEISEFGQYDYGYITLFVGSYGGVSPFNFEMAKGYVTSNSGGVDFNTVHGIRTYGNGSSATRLMNITQHRQTQIYTRVNSGNFGYGSGFQDVQHLIASSFNTGTVIQNPITYIPINSTLSGPESATSGETVNVSVSFPDGYIYQETGVSIYNKDGAIPFIYTDGTLSFTMP